MELARTWIGWSIVAVGIIHTTVGLFVFGEQLSGIVEDGLWNVVDGVPGRPVAFWFMMSGLCFILLGLAIVTLQRAGIAVPSLLAWVFAAMVAIAVIAMPFSGAWLLVPAAIGLLVNSVRARRNARSTTG